MKLKPVSCTLLMLVSAHAYAQDNSFLIDTNPASGRGGQAQCSEYPDYQQPLDFANFGTARTSDAQIPLEVAEDIVDGAMISTLPSGGTIEGVRFWGISAEFNAGFLGECLADNTANTPFVFNFYDDNAGTPGTLLDSRTVAPTSITDTTEPFAFATIFEYDANFAPVDNTDVSWISIQRETGVQAASGNDCYFLWVNETDPGTYDNVNVEILTPAPETYDLTMCLVAGAGPTTTEIPTLGQLAMLLLGLMLAGSALVVIRR